MIILQVVGVFQCESQEEALELGQKLGTMLKDATKGRKGTIYAQAQPEVQNETILSHMQALVDTRKRAAN